MIEWIFLLLISFAVFSLLMGIHFESSIFYALAGLVFILTTMFIWTGGLSIDVGDITGTITDSTFSATTNYTVLQPTAYSELWVFNMLLTGVGLACIGYALAFGDTTGKRQTSKFG